MTRSSQSANAFSAGMLVACAMCWCDDAGLAQGSAAAPGIGDEAPLELPTDLDRRIADLEQSAARTDAGNVSVQLYGQVNRAVIAWDDGFVTDARSIDNSTSSTRVGMFGQGRVGERWALGYRLEPERKAASRIFGICKRGSAAVGYRRGKQRSMPITASTITSMSGSCCKSTRNQGSLSSGAPSLKPTSCAGVSGWSKHLIWLDCCCTARRTTTRQTLSASPAAPTRVFSSTGVGATQATSRACRPSHGALWWWARIHF